MEKELNSIETKLFDLIESKDFSDLNQADKIFVLEQISIEDYEFQRQIISEAKNVEKENLKPRPLQIPVNEKVSNGKVIPLYQAILAVASVVILFILIWPKNEIITKNPIQLSENDTIIQTKVIHDTFVKYVPEIKYIEKNNPQTKIEYVTIYEQKTSEEPRLLEVTQSLNLPPITKESIQKKGNTLKEDQSSKCIKPIFISN